MQLRIYILLMLQARCVDASGQLIVRLVSYSNSEGSSYAGKCCDSRLVKAQWTCDPGCDHYFEICADLINGPDDMGTCHYGSVTTQPITDTNVITFNDTIGLTSNPVTIPFREWEGAVRLKINVWDEDGGYGGGHDFVDFLSVRQPLRTASSPAEASNYSLLLVKRTRLKVNVSVFCDPHWYGARCAVHCVPRHDDGEHFACHRTSGRRICHEGWTGYYCNHDINECASSPCHNGGKCLDRVNGFVCNCISQFTGRLCEQAVSQCLSDPCLNGATCADLGLTFRCQCAQGFTGRLCQHRSHTQPSLSTTAYTRYAAVSTNASSAAVPKLTTLPTSTAPPTQLSGAVRITIQPVLAFSSQTINCSSPCSDIDSVTPGAGGKEAMTCSAVFSGTLSLDDEITLASTITDLMTSHFHDNSTRITLVHWMYTCTDSNSTVILFEFQLFAHLHEIVSALACNQTIINTVFVNWTRTGPQFNRQLQGLYNNSYSGHKQASCTLIRPKDKAVISVTTSDVILTTVYIAVAVCVLVAAAVATSYYRYRRRAQRIVIVKINDAAARHAGHHQVHYDIACEHNTTLGLPVYKRSSQDVI